MDTFDYVSNHVAIEKFFSYSPVIIYFLCAAAGIEILKILSGICEYTCSIHTVKAAL